MTDLDLETRPCLHDGEFLGPPVLPGDSRGPVWGPGNNNPELEPTDGKGVYMFKPDIQNNPNIIQKPDTLVTQHLMYSMISFHDNWSSILNRWTCAEIIFAKNHTFILQT